MARSTLYFPYINIVDDTWLRNAILYWDEISSIVPNEYYDEISPELRYLQQQDFYRPIYPGDLFFSSLRKDFEEEVITRFRCKIDPPFSRNPIDNTQRIHRDKMLYNGGVRVGDSNLLMHHEKTSSKLIGFFERHGMINRSGDGEWLKMDRDLANLYMSILAKYLARIDESDMSLSTDDKGCIRLAYANVRNGIGRYNQNRSALEPENRKNNVGLSVINDIMPTPCGAVPYEKLLGFRMKRRNELLSFRKVIDEYELKLNETRSYEERKHLVQVFSEEIEKELLQMGKLFRGSKIKYFLSNVESLVPVEATHSSSIHEGRVSLEFLKINFRKSQTEKNDGKGFVYLYYAKKEGIL